MYLLTADIDKVKQIKSSVGSVSLLYVVCLSACECVRGRVRAACARGLCARLVRAACARGVCMCCACVRAFVCVCLCVLY